MKTNFTPDSHTNCSLIYKCHITNNPPPFHPLPPPLLKTFHVVILEKELHIKRLIELKNIVII